MDVITILSLLNAFMSLANWLYKAAFYHDIPEEGKFIKKNLGKPMNLSLKIM